MKQSGTPGIPQPRGQALKERLRRLINGSIHPPYHSARAFFSKITPAGRVQILPPSRATGKTRTEGTVVTVWLILPSFHPSILPSFHPSILPSFHLHALGSASQICVSGPSGPAIGSLSGSGTAHRVRVPPNWRHESRNLWNLDDPSINYGLTMTLIFLRESMAA